ncbi:polysaccharide export protein [Marinilabiliaceae bacterium ANBcel2]|nr:polysaccharide export protein [Marinilabiliaceae bacterium ANBcel2]
MSNRRTVYLQGDIAKHITKTDSRFLDVPPDYKVQPGDLLYIRISSLDEQSSSFLNNESQYTTMASNAMSASLLGYRTNSDGSINYPFIGRIYVAGLTVQDITSKIETAVSRYVEHSSAIVKLLNDNITVVGEVRSPGRFPLNSEQISVIEAIGMAGDMTDFGNRKRVRLIRKQGGEPKIIVMDTTKDSLLFSDYYYIQPGDIVYVEPKRSKKWSFYSVPVSLSLSIISTSALLYTIIIDD